MASKRRARAESRALKRWEPSSYQPPMVRVIVKTQDGSRDRLVPRDVVMAKYREHELIYDLTNDTYALPDDGPEPKWIQQYNRV